MNASRVEVPAAVDLWNLASFAADGGLGQLELVRAAGPVAWHDRPGGEPFWAVTSHEAAKAVLRTPLSFSSASAHGGMFLRSAGGIERDVVDGVGGPMIETDPPRHQAQRRVLAGDVSRSSVADLERRVREIAVGYIDDATDKGTFDFVTDVAHQIPAAVTLELMGVPRADWERLAEAQHRCLPSEPGQVDNSGAALMELATYFFSLLTDKNDTGGSDLLCRLLDTTVDGELRGVMGVISEAVLLLNGGLDTTRAAASAGGLLPLLQHPDQLERLRSDPGLLPAAVEEFVRWASPIRHVARTACHDVIVEGAEIAAGDRVGIWLGACNRDSTMFADPNRFDTARQSSPHLGFSFGEHFCLGIHLARLVLRVEFEEILRRWDTIELSGEPAGVWSNFVGGLRSLPIRVTPRRR